MLSENEVSLWKSAVPNGEGTMAAILGLDRENLSAVTKEVTEAGFPVQLANLNCPGQIVISGSKKGVEQASERAKEAGAKRVIPLEVSGPFHSSLMKPAAVNYRRYWTDIEMKDAAIPVIANVSAEPMSDASEIKEN